MRNMSLKLFFKMLGKLKEGKCFNIKNEDLSCMQVV